VKAPVMRPGTPRARTQVLKIFLSDHHDYFSKTMGTLQICMCLRYLRQRKNALGRRVDSILFYIVEQRLKPLDSGTVSMEEAFYFAYHTMEKGTKPALQKQFGVS